MKVTVPTYQTIPKGVYPAVVGEIEEVGEIGPFGAALRWNVHVYLPEGGTERVSALSSINFGPRSKAYRWASILLGRKLAASDTIDTDELTGMACQAEVGLNEAGWNTLEDILPARAGGVPKPAAEPSAFVPPDEAPF